MFTRFSFAKDTQVDIFPVLLYPIFTFYVILNQWFSKWVESPPWGDFEGQGG